MGLSDIIRKGVATAHKIVEDLEADVIHYAWIATAGDGEHIYADPVVRKGIVQRVQRRTVTLGLQEMTSRATIMFPFPIEPNGAPGRQEPLDSRDKFILSDGTTGPVLDIQGIIDSKTGKPYYYEVWLGWYI